MLPTDEGKNTNHGRNVLFELNLASTLWRADLHPERGEHPDVRCWVDRRPIYIQGKRPLPAKGADKAFSKAV